MWRFAIDKSVLLVGTVIDGSLLAVLLTVWSIEDYSNLVKLITSLVVGGLSITRWVIFIIDRVKKRNGKNISKT